MNINFEDNGEKRSFTLADLVAFMSEKQVLGQLISKTIAEALAEFIIDRSLESRSQSTLRFYKQFLAPFLEFAGKDTQVNKITPNTIKAYLASKQDSHEYAHHSRFRAIRAFMNWCVSQHYIPSTPVTIKAPKLPQPVFQIFSDDEIRAMVKSCNTKLGTRDKAIIMVLVDTGMRLSELTVMELGDIELQARVIKVRGKGKKERLLRISPATMKVLWQYLKDRQSNDKRVWLSEERKPLTTSGIEQIVEKITNKAGITGKRHSPHIFRHTFACNFLDQGGQELELQYLLGHSTLTMVERYSRATKAKRALVAHERFSPVYRLNLK